MSGGGPAGQARGAIGKAGSQLRVLVAYNIFNRDCGNMSSGGAADAPAYKSWIDSFANGTDAWDIDKHQCGTSDYVSTVQGPNLFTLKGVRGSLPGAHQPGAPTATCAPNRAIMVPWPLETSGIRPIRWTK